MLSTAFDDITVQGMLSTPLHPHIIASVIILKFLGRISRISITKNKGIKKHYLGFLGIFQFDKF
ncbi:hypothetical protein B5J93_00445 [Moraxella equi]|uniref:Uncharacterized protein n=1 Tax=Moraxella equi TaxID=60442 RepID=A0ABX3NLC7_9GAMM|nr:hypothetical protein B5J93_00445 [Moraxella equi]